jgi:hypothetical protein
MARARSLCCEIGNAAPQSTIVLPADLTSLLCSTWSAGLTVCNVMVCAQQLQFSSSGVPITRQAALKAAAAVARNASAAAADDDVVRPTSLLETCSGFTTQDWRACPTGKQVILSRLCQLVVPALLIVLLRQPNDTDATRCCCCLTLLYRQLP